MQIMSCRRHRDEWLQQRRGKDSGEILDRLFVISLEDDELVLVEVEGDLKEAISTVIREKGMKINI